MGYFGAGGLVCCYYLFLNVLLLSFGLWVFYCCFVLLLGFLGEGVFVVFYVVGFVVVVVFVVFLLVVDRWLLGSDGAMAKHRPTDFHRFNG